MRILLQLLRHRPHHHSSPSTTLQHLEQCRQEQPSIRRTSYCYRKSHTDWFRGAEALLDTASDGTSPAWEAYAACSYEKAAKAARNLFLTSESKASPYFHPKNEIAPLDSIPAGARCYTENAPHNMDNHLKTCPGIRSVTGCAVHLLERDLTVIGCSVVKGRALEACNSRSKAAVRVCRTPGNLFNSFLKPSIPQKRSPRVGACWAPPVGHTLVLGCA